MPDQPVQQSPAAPTGTFLVREPSGEFRVVKGTKLEQYQPPAAQAPPPSPQQPRPLQTVPAAPPPPAPPTPPPPPNLPVAEKPQIPRVPMPVVSPTPRPVASSPTPAPVAVVPAPAPIPPPPPPPQPQATGPAAAYEYDAQDAEEIRTQALRLAGIGPKGPAQDYDRIIDHIIQEHHLTFDDPILEKRLRTMVTARLKDVRGTIETKERLQRAVKIGGLGFDDATASTVMSAVEKYASRVRQGEVIHPPAAPASAPMSPTTPSVHEQLLARIREQIATPSVPPPAVPVPTAPAPSVPPPPPKPTVQMQKPMFENVTPSAARLPARQAPVAPPPMPSPMVLPPLRRSMEFSDKPRMADIRAPYRVLGPVDELRTMSLDEFRRLGTTVADATKKLMEKINLLEEESYTKRADGIAAWKQSPVNQLYLDVGRASMEAAKPVEDVIHERQQAGTPTLTIDEFTGVVDLNRLLRF